MEALFKALIWIQQNLQAPKSEYNSFGKYNYRRQFIRKVQLPQFRINSFCPETFIGSTALWNQVRRRRSRTWRTNICEIYPLLL